MSSIDKFVKDVACGLDHRVRVINSFGRIKGYIGTVKVFDIADRHGYIDSDEREAVEEGIRYYHLNEARLREEEARRRAEEERRRIEEERRRAEEARQTALRKLRESIERKKSSVNANISSVNEVYNNKLNEVKAVVNEIKKVKSQFPKGNVSKLELKGNELVQKVNTNFEVIKRNLEGKNEQIEIIKRKVRDNLTVEQIEELSREISRVDTKNETLKMNINTNSLSEEVKIAKENAKKISELLARLSNVKDEKIKAQIEIEISDIDLCDTVTIQRVMNSIENRVENYRISLGAKLTKEIMDELNTIEGISKAIKTLNEYTVTDTYSISKQDKEIIEKASTLSEMLIELSEAEFKVLDDDLESNLKELFEIAVSPKNSVEEQETLKRIEVLVRRKKDLLDEYQVGYQKYKELREMIESVEVVGDGEEIKDLLYDKPFDYRNVNQIKEMEIVYVKRLQAHESMIVESISVDVVDAMSKTGYHQFYVEKGNGYKEIFFINEKYPGVLTRVFVSHDGTFRRSLIPVKIGNNVTKIEKIIEMAKEIEMDVVQFLKEYSAKAGKNVKLSPEMVNYNSPNVKEVLENTGYFEITGKGVEVYNQVMSVNASTNTVKRKYSAQDLFEQYNSSHKKYDSTKEKTQTSSTTKSYRYQK